MQRDGRSLGAVPLFSTIEQPISLPTTGIPNIGPSRPCHVHTNQAAGWPYAVHPQPSPAAHFFPSTIPLFSSTAAVYQQPTTGLDNKRNWATAFSMSTQQPSIAQLQYQTMAQPASWQGIPQQLGGHLPVGFSNPAIAFGSSGLAPPLPSGPSVHILHLQQMMANGGPHADARLLLQPQLQQPDAACPVSQVPAPYTQLPTHPSPPPALPSCTSQYDLYMLPSLLPGPVSAEDAQHATRAMVANIPAALPSPVPRPGYDMQAGLPSEPHLSRGASAGALTDAQQTDGGDERVAVGEQSLGCQVGSALPAALQQRLKKKVKIIHPISRAWEQEALQVDPPNGLQHAHSDGSGSQRTSVEDCSQEQRPTSATGFKGASTDLDAAGATPGLEPRAYAAGGRHTGPADQGVARKPSADIQSGAASGMPTVRTGAASPNSLDYLPDSSRSLDAAATPPDATPQELPSEFALSDLPLSSMGLPSGPSPPLPSSLLGTADALPSIRGTTPSSGALHSFPVPAIEHHIQLPAGCSGMLQPVKASKAALGTGVPPAVLAVASPHKHTAFEQGAAEAASSPLVLAVKPAKLANLPPPDRASGQAQMKNDHTKPSGRSLQDVSGQLSLLYHWYISNKNLYLRQASDFLQLLQHAPAKTGREAIDTEQVLSAFEKALQIMKASSEVEQQWLGSDSRLPSKPLAPAPSLDGVVPAPPKLLTKADTSLEPTRPSEACIVPYSCSAAMTDAVAVQEAL